MVFKPTITSARCFHCLMNMIDGVSGVCESEADGNQLSSGNQKISSSSYSVAKMTYGEVDFNNTSDNTNQELPSTVLKAYLKNITMKRQEECVLHLTKTRACHP